MLPILRAATTSFTNESGKVCWRGLNGKIYGRKSLENMGLSERIINKGNFREKNEEKL